MSLLLTIFCYHLLLSSSITPSVGNIFCGKILLTTNTIQLLRKVYHGMLEGAVVHVGTFTIFLRKFVAGVNLLHVYSFFFSVTLIFLKK